MRRTKRTGGHRVLRTALAMSTCALASLWAIMASAQELPATAEPWQFERQRDLLREPQSTPEPVLPAIPAEAFEPKEAADITFALTDIEIEGASIYAPATFSSLYENALGTIVSLADIYEIANAITARYRNEGYVLSRAIVPPQRIEGGKVKIQVVEGYVDTVVVEGGTKHMRKVAEGYGRKITRSRPLHIDTLERYLLLIRDLPGVFADSILRAARGAPGASELVIRLRYDPVEVSMNVDNRGSKFLGRIQASPMARFNYFFGSGNQTTIRYLGTGIANHEDSGKLNYFELRHKQVIGTEGTALSFTYSRVRSTPGFTLAEFDVRNRGERVVADLTHPLIRTRRQSLYASLIFEVKNAETDFLADLLSEDRIRTLGASVAYDFIDDWRGSTLLELGFNKGLDIFSSSKGSATPSRLGGEADFFKLWARATRIQRLAENFNLLIALAGQYSDDNLLAPEEFSVGGSVIGRGYDFGEITGDRGFAGKLELQYTVTPNAGQLRDYQLYGFFDFGLADQIGPDKSLWLTSAGAGVRFALVKRLNGFFEIAKPLNRAVSARDPDNGKDVRFLFGFLLRN